ncbi:MAG TPA: 4Fe-4S cluster-binding domain-containing protein [Candidatus Omnitrophica bacterium]|nr:4Fe-4S cluster-binding domain-containing protein [Candidatus Omnitrophota bacterium]
MNTLSIPEPVSGGILLSYKCTEECKHCIYACSPKWSADWLSEKSGEKILTWIASKLPSNPLHRIGVNYGLHFTGGEPFLNFKLLLKLVRIARELNIGGTFVETNCFWCVNDEITHHRLNKLKEAGLDGILVSANPFIVEGVPFERIKRAIEISKKIFAGKVLVYHDLFYRHLKQLNFEKVLPFKKYMEIMSQTDKYSLYSALSFPSILPIGRAPYRLGYLYRKHPPRYFFNHSCKEELTRNWHVHVDNYGNYITGYCAGISLGNILEGSGERQLDLDSYPILQALLRSIRKLYEVACTQFGYKELEGGYLSKCHLCLDIRRHIISQTQEFKELKPTEFYSHL